MECNDFLDLVRKRRSIRSFQSKPLPDGCIDNLIEAARWAPSGYNSQPWEFVVVSKQALKDRIGEMAVQAMRAVFSKNQKAGEAQVQPPAGMPMPKMKWTEAPALILVLGDTRVRQYCPFPVLRDNEAAWQSIFKSSLAIAFEHMALAAVTMGLGSQWVSIAGGASVSGEIKKLLGIPESMVIFDMMAVGYPAEEPVNKKIRAKEEMVHYDTCVHADFRTDEQVHSYFG
jgi:nitroreductase